MALAGVETRSCSGMQHTVTAAATGHGAGTAASIACLKEEEYRS